jgi:hypothetical protein
MVWGWGRTFWLLHDFVPESACWICLTIPSTQAHERLKKMPDVLAAVVVGSVKAAARARQCRSVLFFFRGSV